MRFRWTRWAAGICLGTMVACGNGGNSTPQAAESSIHAVSSAAAKAHAQALHDACEAQVGDFLTALDDLNARLDVGLTQHDYNDKLGDVSVAYHKIDFKDVSAAGKTCLTDVGIPAENALNKYISADTKWANCINHASTCSQSSNTAALQGLWSDASTSIKSAKDALDALAVPPPPSPTPTST